MASMKIHQDLYNFERKRKGFTPRQLKALRNGVFVAVLCAALFGYALELPPMVVWCVVPCAAIVPVACGFFPIWNMPAEEFFGRLLDLNERGNALAWDGEEIEMTKGEVSRAYRKKERKRGFECGR
ncbi:hypothetical protein [Raoultibacter timonensis]|uniref:PrgI family protein n=1 Tax=Raoultibacter timonensis TaxID=1907662 RepID=A0ABN6MEX8_9ACTN|nr:hypothetical protein [Raoultibacter timonensis]BDE94841.1 hypothetical protein CE91St30_01740 [Raoultibacter timonensis]BDF49444.1 hypothetical protein CE91St31_01740 [Raoultibacter timonensis]